MRAIILAVLLVGAFCATSMERQLIKDLFTQWKLTFNKNYNSLEEENRFTVFVNNYIKIQAHNQQNSNVVLGLNQFADLTNEEFTRLYTGAIPQENTNAHTSNLFMRQLPESVDWRNHKAVTPVKNQLACGSCWAFSAVGALEALYSIQHGELDAFSEQHMVDCVRGGSHGCNGGWMSDAFDYVAQNGIQRSVEYPYVAKTQTCNVDTSKTHRINTAYLNVTAKSAGALKTAIVANPVSVAIQANQIVFQFYKSGVITTGCGDSLNHGVLAVGYEVVGGVEAFIVKNSWGTIWGNNGYVLIGSDESQNNGNGVCGILKNSCYPIAN